MGDDRHDPADRLDRAEIRDLLAKGWLTHDGMWFDQAARSFGVEAANALNRAAIRAMAPFEVGRLAAALGVDPAAPRDCAAVVRFVAEGIDLVTPASVSQHLRVRAGADDTLHWEWDPGECFAYRGMARFGHLEGYRCGVIYRVECWLAALGARPLGDPAIEGCLMADTGRCSGALVLDLPA